MLDTGTATWHHAVMSEATYRKTQSPTDTHCDLCGRITHGEHDGDGYSLCCNELLCYGDGACISLITTDEGWTEKLHFRSLDAADTFIAQNLTDATETKS